MASSSTKTRSSGGRRPRREHFRADEVRLGYVSGVFGTRGEVKVFLYNPASDLLEGGADVDLVAPGGDRRAVHLAIRRGAGKRVIGRVSGVDSVEAAQALVDHEIAASASLLPPLGELEYYHRDVLGLPVRTASGTDLGNLAEIYDQGELETWVIRGPDGEHYLPALRELVLAVRPGDVIIVDDDVGQVI